MLVFPCLSITRAPFGSIFIPVSFKNAVFGLTPVAITTKSALYSPLFVFTPTTFRFLQLFPKQFLQDEDVFPRGF